jgi:hypothetical protein
MTSVPSREPKPDLSFSTGTPGGFRELTLGPARRITRYCTTCGAPVWPLKGTNVLTCKRGHHWPNDRKEAP